MNITKTIIINQSADHVWQVVGDEFDQAHVWMSFVKNSYALEQPAKLDDAPMAGRVCRFGDDENATYAEEIITRYDAQNRTIEFTVIPKNAGFLPIVQNKVKIKVDAVGANKSQVTWVSEPELKTFGKLISPLLKFGLGKSFNDVLNELKGYCETRFSAAAATA